MRSARQRGDWCSGSSKKEKVKLREKLRLVTGRSGGRRGGRGTRRWGNTLRLARNPRPPAPGETHRDRHVREWKFQEGIQLPIANSYGLFVVCLFVCKHVYTKSTERFQRNVVE